MAAELRLVRELGHLSIPAGMTVEREALYLKITYLPTDGMWQGQRLSFSLKCPPSYPIDPPRLVSSLPAPFHPCISPVNGAVCLNILRLDWMPVLGVQAILLGLEGLFHLDPLLLSDLDDVLNREAAELLNSDPIAYARRVNSV